MSAELQRCSLDQSEIAYLDLGRGAPLLLVHGFPLDHSMWDGQHALSEHCRLLIPDLPGFGSSRYDGEEWCMDRIASELMKWLDAIQVPQVIYCGLSMGGYLGWRFWKNDPQRLLALIACNTRAAADSEIVARARHMSAAAVRQQGVGGMAAEMIPRLLAEPTRMNRPEIADQVARMISQSSPATVAQAQLAMATRPDATSWLTEIGCPALFVGGQFDPITPSDEMRANARLLTGSQFVEIPQVGHLSPLENPELFNSAVMDFLQSQQLTE